ncbi:MAG: hypothetical protein ACYTFK_11560 [Planctomycetota bacterium]|jgi:hypothetical protein
MSLEPYTNTYTDTDGNIADSGDILAEFDRVASFIDTWSASYESIGLTTVEEQVVGSNGNSEIEPSAGIVQVMKVAASVSELNINVKAREAGDTYRVYVTLRFGSRSTAFTVSGPSGKTHVFGVNRETYQPSQVIDSGWYNAMLIITYGTDGTHITVFANNSEGDSVSADDVMQEIAV